LFTLFSIVHEALNEYLPDQQWLDGVVHIVHTLQALLDEIPSTKKDDVQ
jgi:hypothetical protein